MLVVVVVIYVVNLEDFKQYVDAARCIFWRDLGNEIRIYAGRVGVKIEITDPKERQKIVEWLKTLEKTKTVLEIKDVTSEDQFFI